MRAAVYVRVSTEDQARNGFSLSEQRQACRAKALEAGATSVTFFSDEGVSGELLDDRPGLSALRTAIKRGEVDAIFVRDADRLSRRLAHQLILAEEFEKAGVKLEFLDFSWQDSAEGRLFFSIRSAIAEYEKEKIRDRTVRGRLQKAREGGIPARFDIYGYLFNPETDEVCLHPKEAAVVRMIYNWFVREDLGINGIARRLNAQGVPTRRRVAGWHRQVVRQILMQPAYSGIWYYGRRDCRGAGLNRHRNPGDRVSPKLRDAREWIPIKVPPIVDQELWKRTQVKMEQARRLWAGKQTGGYLLSGILRCGGCGNPLTGSLISRWGRRERRYTCRQSYQPYQGSANCGCRPSRTLGAEGLEKAVWSVLAGWLTDRSRLTDLARRFLQPPDNLKEELRHVRALLGDAERGRENLLGLLASGTVSMEERIVNRLGEIERHVQRLARREQELQARLLDAGAEGTLLGDLDSGVEYLVTNLDSMDIGVRRRLVRLLIKGITVTAGMAELQIEYRS